MRRRRRRRPKKQERPKPKVLANAEIPFNEIRVIDHEGTMLGVMSPREAYEKAQEKELDVVVVNPKAEPPVAKFAELNKFKYQQEKDRRAKKGKRVKVKGVRISIRISENDLRFKARMADKFLDQGDKVRIELMLRGRERQNREFAMKMFDRFVAVMETPVKVEQEVSQQRLGLAMVVAKDTAPVDEDEHEGEVVDVDAETVDESQKDA